MLSVVDIALARAPLLRQIESQTVEIEPLGSLTNLSYKLTTSVGTYVLRLPGEDTFDYIDRRAEEHNSKITASVGINAEVLHFDAEDGTMLSRFIGGGVPMDGGRFQRDPMAPARAALVLRRIHHLGPVFKSRFDVFSMIRGYLDILYKLQMPPPEDYYEVRREAEAIRRVLQASPVGLAPCHNDPWPGNFVVASGGSLHLIDWEFSGMNDPIWDLGDLSGGGWVRSRAGPDDGGGLLRWLRTSGALRSLGALQGNERPPLVPLGPYPVRERQPFRRLFALRTGEAGALQGEDRQRRFRTTPSSRSHKLGAIRSGNFLRADSWDKPLEAVAVGRKRARVVTYSVPVRVVSQDTPAPPVGGVSFLPLAAVCYTQKPVKLNRRD